MIFDKKILFSLLLVADLLVNVLELIPINFLYTTTLISFCVCILLPGLLISLILRIRKVSLWENILFIVGLSIFFWEFGGLLLNILLPIFGINDPLAFHNLIIGFDVYMLLLFFFAWIRTKELTIHVQLPRRSKIEKAFYALPLFFPILASLGAIVLNNGGSNILTLILLGTIAFYALLLVLFREKISIDLYPYAIFFIGLACLFTTSLRSWFITGHDIEIELYVFQLTNVHHIWEMAFYQDPYNACLSITILPTILTNLLSIQDTYVYKVIFQVLFATSPVLVFFIVKKYTHPVFAFLSALFFLSFPLFFTDMPMINRQEIGFIFFGLVVYMMLPSELPLPTRKILFLIFACSALVSHYSTYYILLSLLIFVYVLTRLSSLSVVKNMFVFLLRKTHITFKNRFNTNAFLTLPMLLILLVVSYFWYNIYTHSLNNMGSVIFEVVSGDEIKSSDLIYYLFPAKKDPNQQLQEYIQSLRNSEKANGSQLYSEAIVSKYRTDVLPQELLEPTLLGSLLTTLHIPIYKNQEDFGSFSAILMQIVVLIGWLAIFSFNRLKEKTIDKIRASRPSPILGEGLVEQLSIDKQVTTRLHSLGQHLPDNIDSNISVDAPQFGNHASLIGYKKSFDLQFLLLCFSAIFLLVVMITLPDISALFGVLRMIQQFLFLLSLPVVLGIYSILFFVKEHKRVLFTSIILIIFFLNFTGFIPHLTGDYYPQINLDNSGLYYDIYYVHKSDVLANDWLSKNNIHNELVEADASGVNKLQPYGNMNTSNEIFPAVIQKNAYVYVKSSNTVVVFIYNKTEIINSPKPLLDDYKNLIYSNGDDDIYK